MSTNIYARAARLEKASAIIPVVQRLAAGLGESPTATVRRLTGRRFARSRA